MSEAAWRNLPKFRQTDDPRIVRAYLLAYFDLRDVVAADRRDRCSEMTVRERITMALLAARIEEALLDAWQCLACIARRGGRGVAAR